MTGLKRVIVVYLVLCGLVLHAAAAGGLLYMKQSRGLTWGEFARAAADRVGMDGGVVAEALQPRSRYDDVQTPMQPVPGHPRILLPQLRSGGPIAGPDSVLGRRLAEHERRGMSEAFQPCRHGSIIGRTSCWLATGDEAAGALAIESLKSTPLQAPRSASGAANGWIAPLAFDLLVRHPAMTAADRRIIVERLKGFLAEHLAVLDENSASLWHRRAVLSMQAWIIATAIAGEQGVPADLIDQAFGHYRDGLDALGTSGGWPEGYNYWINNRGLVVAMSANALLNGWQDGPVHPFARKAYSTIADWMIYIVRPDGWAEPIGDEGSRRDLKDETRRVVDLFAQALGTRHLGEYSDYLKGLHGIESYFRGYRDLFVLFNDPGLSDGEDSGEDLFEVGLGLPKTRWFGPGAFDQVVIRSGWTADATMIALRAGRTLTHHGHYDAGHFTLFKGAPLAVSASRYDDGVQGMSRLNFSARSVAKNTLLVLRPNETVQPNRMFQDNVAAGGQRMTMPTGSAVLSTEQWRADAAPGERFAAGSITGFQNEPETFTYVRTDLTDAYNTPARDEGGRGGKVEAVERQFLYLDQHDALLVRDRVVSVAPEFTKKWLLHSINQPEMSGLQLLEGSDGDGIWQTRSPVADLAADDGRLLVQVLEPIDPLVRVLGGPRYGFYVESDGDDSDLDGAVYPPREVVSPYNDNALWRMEVQPARSAKQATFLVALLPSLDKMRDPVESLLLPDGLSGAVIEKTAVIFLSDWQGSPFDVKIPAGVQDVLLVASAVEPAVSFGAALALPEETDRAVLQYSLDGQEGRLEIRAR